MAEHVEVLKKGKTSDQTLCDLVVPKGGEDGSEVCPQFRR